MTADKYELPLMVADSAKELGVQYGVTANTIITLARDNCSGGKIKRKYVKVLNDEWRR